MPGGLEQCRAFLAGEHESLGIRAEYYEACEVLGEVTVVLCLGIEV